MKYASIKQWFNVFFVENDITQRELASVVGVDDAYISAVKLGKRHVSARLLHELMDKYNISQEDVDFLKTQTRLGKKSIKNKNN